MNIPEDLKYTKDHEWVRIIGDEAVAQSELGDIVFVEVDTEGESLAHEEVFGTVEAVKTVSDLFMPIAGKVISFNGDLEDNPELLNSSPYEKGWIIKVSITDDNHNHLLSSDDYRKLIS